MKKSLLTIMAAGFAGMATFFGGAASAGQYTIAPPVTYVTLPLSSFIQSVPYTSWTGSPDPNNPVIGDNLNEHPGAFYTGMPSVGLYFIGVFGRSQTVNDPKTVAFVDDLDADRTAFITLLPDKHAPIIFWDTQIENLCIVRISSFSHIRRSQEKTPSLEAPDFGDGTP